MAANQESKAEHKKPSPSLESVDSLIGKKQAERSKEVSDSVSQKMSGTQQEVSEVIGGAEKPSEKVSERTGERGNQGSLKKGGAAHDDQFQADELVIELKDYHFPSELAMVKKIRAAINAQIKDEWKRAQKLHARSGADGLHGYNSSIARIRTLKRMLTSLYSTTVVFLKNMYVKYFTPDGKRRKTEDIV